MPPICPACKHRMVDVRLEWMHIQVCRSGCKGVWIALSDLSTMNFSEGRLQKVLGEAYVAPLRIRPPGMLRCPRCKVAMKPRIHHATQIQIDVCPACAGVFFDAGELRIIHHAVQLGLHKQKEGNDRKAGAGCDRISLDEVVWVKPGLGAFADIPPLPHAPFSRNLVEQQNAVEHLLEITLHLAGTTLHLAGTKSISADDKVWLSNLMRRFFHWLRHHK